MTFFRKERACCGCSVLLASQILAAVSAVMAICSIFTIFFYDNGWLIVMCQILYSFASVCASALVYQACRTRRAILMGPMMLVAIINIVGLVVVFITCLLTSFGVQTTINKQMNGWYDYVGGPNDWAHWFDAYYGDGTPGSAKGNLQGYEESCAAWWAFSAGISLIFAAWVFIIHFDCFRTLKAGEGYPTAQYHGNDNITVPIYPTYPAPAYDAAAAAATANPAPAYPGPYDIPPSYANAAATTADELPAKVPLP